MLRKLFYVLLILGCTVARAADSAAPPAATAPAAGNNTLIDVGGSDLLQLAVGEPLTRYIKQFHLNVAVDLHGSTPAVEDLKSGKVELAIVAAPIGQSAAPEGFKAIPFCFAVDYIFVNPANPLDSLTLRQVAGIFGESKEAIGEWKQLKLSGDWANRPIVAYSTSPDDGVVIEMLKYLVLDRQPLRPTVHILNTPDETIAAVGNSPNGIGLCGYDPGAPSKVLLISPDREVNATKPPAPPTPENISSGAYPLRLPFYLVYSPANQARVAPLLRLLLSDAYATRLRDAHFVPVPDLERNRALLGLDKPN